MDNKPKSLEQLVEHLTDEVNNYKMKFLKASSEAINTRKRVMKEKDIAIKFANEKFANDLLDTVDNFENMLRTEMTQELRAASELIYKGLIDTLKKNNVVECKTNVFDPDFHQVISTVKSFDAPNTIVKVLRKGYMIENRLLRPALVIVSIKE